MERTRNDCIFPLNEQERKSIEVCTTSLIYAARQGKLSCVKELTAAGADGNAVCECHGEGALQAAVRGRNPFCLIEVIRAGADVNHKNKIGSTAAMMVSDSECLEELIEAAANVNIQDDYKFTPLMYAAEEGNAEIVKMMIAVGADVNAQT